MDPRLQPLEHQQRRPLLAQGVATVAAVLQGVNRGLSEGGHGCRRGPSEILV